MDPAPQTPGPEADAKDGDANFDLSKLRGATPEEATPKDDGNASNDDDDLDALSELVPDLKNRKTSLEHKQHFNGMTVGEEQQVLPSGEFAVDAAAGEASKPAEAAGDGVNRIDSMGVQSSKEQTGTEGQKSGAAKQASYIGGIVDSVSSSSDGFDGRDVNEVLYGNGKDDDVNSDRALSNSDHSKPRPPNEVNENLGLGGDFQNISSAQSLSTATQTHEVRMPMYLPTFKPATGCTNASDFIVRCFVARLRSGITVVKHGRSRWCKSRLRILHIHADGRSLSWKPAQGEPTSSKRPPKLDLTTCLEVRHAWSPDPQNPMYTGTPILRQKCEAANAHKSFALIFPKRTVDITSVTADQCKVLMEGFSALCFRLQVANLAGQGDKKGVQKMPEEEEVATTASVTLTNNSTLSPHNRR
jgi:hypothetical protein